MNILKLIFGKGTTPTHCRCGRRADVYDHERPWIVWCGKCYLKHIGKG